MGEGVGGGDVSRVLASAFTSCYALGKEISHFYGMVCVYNFIPMTLNSLFIMTVKMKSEKGRKDSMVAGVFGTV